jgi:hypothetical protein
MVQQPPIPIVYDSILRRLDKPSTMLCTQNDMRAADFNPSGRQT